MISSEPRFRGRLGGGCKFQTARVQYVGQIVNIDGQRFLFHDWFTPAVVSRTTPGGNWGYPRCGRATKCSGSGHPVLSRNHKKRDRKKAVIVNGTKQHRHERRARREGKRGERAKIRKGYEERSTPRTLIPCTSYTSYRKEPGIKLPRLGRSPRIILLARAAKPGTIVPSYMTTTAARICGCLYSTGTRDENSRKIQDGFRCFSASLFSLQVFHFFRKVFPSVHQPCQQEAINGSGRFASWMERYTAHNKFEPTNSRQPESSRS